MTLATDIHDERTAPRHWTDAAGARAYLDISQRTLDNYVKAGTITAYRIRGSRLRRFDLAELDALLVAA